MHTPGPWEIEIENNAVYIIAPDGSNKLPWSICRIYEYAGPDDDASEANAILIAAAPEMLKALEWIVNNPHSHIENVYGVCREAIAKAKGN